MKFERSTKSLSSVTCDLAIIAVTAAEVRSSSKKSNPHLRALDQKLKGALSAFIRQESFNASDLSVLEFPVVAERTLRKVILVGWGTEAQEDELHRVDRYRRFGALVQRYADKSKANLIAVAGVPDLLSAINQAALSEGMGLMAYSFTRYKSKKASAQERSAKLKELNRTITLIGLPPTAKSLATTEGLELSCGTALARDLVNTPPCDCTPSYLVDTARSVARQGRLQCTVYDAKALKKMGANALLAVSHGSAEPPYLVKLTYRPKGKVRRVISLVGKGITFDSGGLCIKTAAGMDTMKMDMGGAAAVIGAMQVISALKPRGIEVRGYIPTAENMTGPAAMRPGDVVTALNGKTIEILNTDAEGRLILADALSLAVKEKSDTIIDLATLTGACVVALGGDYAGLFTTDEKLAADLQTAGDLSGERLWRMPLPNEYFEMIKSSVADIKNTGGRSGGAITAALFLREFATIKSWAHLDIAGPAWADSDSGYLKKGGVGFGVRTLVRYVLGQALQ